MTLPPENSPHHFRGVNPQPGAAYNPHVGGYIPQPEVDEAPLGHNLPGQLQPPQPPHQPQAPNAGQGSHQGAAPSANNWPQLPQQFPNLPQPGGAYQIQQPYQAQPGAYQSQQPYQAQTNLNAPQPPQPTFRAYSGGMPPGLSAAQRRRWQKQNGPARPRPKRLRLNLALLLIVMLAVSGLRISASHIDMGPLNALFGNTEMRVPPQTSAGSGAPVAPPTVTNPSDSYEFWHVAGKENGVEIPARWSSCEPIRYVVNPKFGDEHFLDWVHATVDEVSTATGLQFEYEGLTGEEPRAESPFPTNDSDDFPPVVIQFANEDQIPELADNVEGLAILQQTENAFTGTVRFVTGKVYLDETLLYDRPIDREPAYVHVLRHELAHIAGLGHIDDSKELMHEAPIAHKFGDGDLTGLSKLGGGPCQ